MNHLLLPWSLLLVSAALSLLGCRQGEEAKPATRAAETQQAAPPPPAPAAPVTLTILCPPGLLARNLTTLAEEYTAQNGLKITIDAQPRDQLAAARRADFTSKAGKYDLLVLDSRDLGEAVEGKHLMTLTETIKGYPEIFGSVPPAALAACAYPPGSQQYFGVPCPGDGQVLSINLHIPTDKRKLAALKFVRWFSTPETHTKWGQPNGLPAKP